MREFVHARVPDPAWVRALETIAPKEGGRNWLALRWFAGWEYEPVQRWRIFEMVPNRAVVHGEVLDDCRGPSPRDPSNGVWVEDPELAPWGKVGPHGYPMRWRSHSLVDFDQWELFHATNCFAVPVWIVQGTKGGHAWRLSQAELGYLESTGITKAELPLPGDLPYADPNERTFAQLGERDALRRWRLSLTSWEDRMTKTQAGLWVARDRKAEEEQYNARLMRWLDDQIEQAVDCIGLTNLPGPSDLPEGDRYYNRDEDALEQDFIENTATSVE